MYSWALASVNAAALAGAGAHPAVAQDAPPTPSDLRCDAALTAMFAPPRPQLGRYQVCRTDAPLDSLAKPGWWREPMGPLDALGPVGRYDRGAAARLFGGRRVDVARGWFREGGRFEAWTLVSPHPDATLTRILPGTLVIRFILDEDEP